MTDATGGVTSAPCPHGRASWASCPHCLGINGPALLGADPPAPEPRVYSFTRDQLIGALTRHRPSLRNPESVADAIIGALEDGQDAATGDGRDRQRGKDPATRLIEAAFFLRQNGERPPGAPADDLEAETWGRWDREAEVFLRERQARQAITINNPQVSPPRPWPYDGPEGRARLTGSLDAGGSFTGDDDDDSGERHVIYCRGCRKAWAELPERRPFADPPVDQPSSCACVCRPGDPQYEDWAVDPDPADIPEGAWT